MSDSSVPPVADDSVVAPTSRVRQVALVAGPLLFALILAVAPGSLSRDATAVLGIALWMAAWWLAEPVPLAATSMLPLALFPMLGVATSREAAAPYANDLVFLFLAGFLLAAALERWNAHARIAYAMIAVVGVQGRRVVLAFMVATAFISLWISNTATAAMLYPIALAIGQLFGGGDDGRRARSALMLGLAYAASIGGMGTLIGTPPNLIFAGAAGALAGRQVSFVEFMAIGIPLVVVLLPLCWALLVFVLHPVRIALGDDARELVAGRRAALGPLRGGEARVLLVFALTALAWLLRERKELDTFTIPGLVDLAPQLSDAAIGITAAIALFALRGRTGDGDSRPLLTWREARGIPWEVLLLFGGGLSLAAAMESTGVARWLGSMLGGLASLPPLAVLFALAIVVVVLSELASNTAVATMTMPIAAALAPVVHLPALELMLVTALASSAGFALPIATPPNTIVFGSGQVGVRQMARAGVLLDALAIIVVVLGVHLLYGLVF